MVFHFTKMKTTQNMLSINKDESVAIINLLPDVCLSIESSFLNSLMFKL